MYKWFKKKKLTNSTKLTNNCTNNLKNQNWNTDKTNSETNKNIV